MTGAAYKAARRLGDEKEKHEVGILGSCLLFFCLRTWYMVWNYEYYERVCEFLI